MKIDAIVLIHRGGHDYVRDVLKIAATSNPNTRIVLLGDEENRAIIPNIEHYFISDYENDVRRLEEVYLHLSTNPYDFELFCLSRWLILNCFCQKQGMNGIFHADSDVLIYSSINDIAGALNDCKLAVSWGLSPHASFWTAEALSDFADFVVSTYQTKDAPPFRELAAHHNRVVRERRPGGVSDMTFINMFSKDIKCFDLTSTILDGTFDHNINMSDNKCTQFEMFRGIKKLTWRQSIPYGRALDQKSNMRFHTLHCQGEAKRWIKELCAERPPASQIEAWRSRIIDAIKHILRVGGKLLRHLRADPLG
jgi:hypothetical protein